MSPEILARLQERAKPHAPPWGADGFRAILDAPGTLLHGDSRGFALGRVAADEAELLLIATDPAHRRRGLARRWLAGYEADARHAGAARSFLEVAEGNAAARALYASAGYAETGRRKDYYRWLDGRREAAIVMARALR